MRASYTWKENTIPLMKAKDLTLDFGLAPQGPVQMRRAYQAVVGIATGYRKHFCGTKKHCDRIIMVCQMLEDRWRILQKKGDLWAQVPTNGHIQINEVPTRIGTFIEQRVETREVGVIWHEKFDDWEFRKGLRKNNPIETEVRHRNRLTLNHYKVAKRDQEECRRKIDQKQQDLDNGKYLNQAVGEKFVRLEKERLEVLIAKENNERLARENIEMAIEDARSKLYNSCFKMEKTIIKHTDRTFKSKEWITPVKTFKMNHRAKLNLEFALRTSKGKYMDYFLYKHREVNRSSIPETNSVSSANTHRSRFVRKMQDRSITNWEALDEHLNDLRTRNLDDVSERILNASHYTEVSLRERSSEIRKHALCLLWTEDMVPTYIRRFCHDFVLSQVTKYPFNALRRNRMEKNGFKIPVDKPPMGKHGAYPMSKPKEVVGWEDVSKPTKKKKVKGAKSVKRK